MSDDDWPMVRIMVQHETDDGFLFWPGDTFHAMMGPPFDDGTEVKTAGEYVWIPSSCFEVLP